MPPCADPAERRSAVGVARRGPRLCAVAHAVATAVAVRLPDCPLWACTLWYFMLYSLSPPKPPDYDRWVLAVLLPCPDPKWLPTYLCYSLVRTANGYPLTAVPSYPALRLMLSARTTSGSPPGMAKYQAR